jgi:hypothetical protein
MTQSNQQFSSINQAADAILALINSKPQTPRRDELAAILAPHMNGPGPALRWQDTPLGAEWLALEAELYKITEEKDLLPDDPGYDRAQAEVDAVRDRVEAFVLRIWETRATTLRDAIHRTAMAVHWNHPAKLDDPPFPDDVIAGDPNRNFDERALAHVVRGILDLAGLKFDADGRIA